jgi:hypothetical protein
MTQFAPKNDPGNLLPAMPAQQPGQTAIARLFATAKMLAGYGFVLMFLLMVAEKILPPELKPSHVIGTFGGDVERNEIAAKQPAAVEFARRQAEAQATMQAKAAKKAEIIGGSEGVKSFAAQMADLACMAGQFVPRNAPNPDTRTTGEALRSACGVSGKIRNDMAHDLDEAGQPAPVN